MDLPALAQAPSSLAAPGGTSGAAPEPLGAGELDACLAELEAGAELRPALERLLLALPLERAQRLMLLLREGRAAWIPLLEQSAGSALFVGNALSGTVAALAVCGFRPTALDRSAERLRFARERGRRIGRSPVTAVLGAGPALPFRDAAFDLVVREPGPGAVEDAAFEAELRRVARGELVVVAENRLAYKRSLGRQGEFRVPGPLAYARQVLRPGVSERSLRGHRAALRAAGLGEPRAFALYPHAEDYAQVAAIGARGPRLLLGPKERRNLWKLAGRAAGLFPVLAPSFALVARANGSSAPEGAAPRVARIFDALSERLGEPAMEVEHLVATRGHTALFLTRPRGRSAADGGRLCVRVPTSVGKRALTQRHVAALRHLRGARPELPVPEPLFEGALEGTWVAVERRVEGRSASQLASRRERIGRTLAGAARDLAGLVRARAARLDDEGFERHLGWRIELAARHAGDADARAALGRLRDEARERLEGRPLPLALCHGDLRGKHVQAREDGSVLAYLDWGTWEEEGPAYWDLLHLLVHERRQAHGLDAERAWRLLSEPGGLRPGERAALDDYARRCELDPEVRAALEALYPVLVAAMAERTWDYSRPRWLRRQYGIGRER